MHLCSLNCGEFYISFLSYFDQHKCLNQQALIMVASLKISYKKCHLYAKEPITEIKTELPDKNIRAIFLI